jgi:ABC-type amino acid transport system permease subunit
MLPTPVVAAVIAPFVLWRVYNRIKRLTSRQRSKTWRHRTTLVFFPLLLLALAAASLQTGPIALAGLAAGLPLGLVLGRIAIGKTRFEQVGAEFYFTPHAPIGMLIALLFMGRMGYRAYEYFALGSFAHHEFVTSPLTLFIFGLLAGYYMSFAFGLLAWRRRTASH